MSTALLIVLMSLSAILLAGAILIGVRHFWRLERELDEEVAHLLSEAESTATGSSHGEAAAREGRAEDADGNEGRA